MDEETRKERLRLLNDRLLRIRGELADFIASDDTTLTPKNERQRRRLIRLEYHLSKYLAQVSKPTD